MVADFLLYGSYGYTGRLIAERAVEAGLRPLLAGRDAAALAAHAAETGLPHRVLALDDAAGLQAALRGVPVVLNAAGPFARTAAPMAGACLRAGAHYLDVTGEISVFEGLAARDAEAGAAGVMLLPGVGFDVVPTDCLAAHLKRRLPSATRLVLALQGDGGVSRGTAITALENVARGGMVRRAGVLTPVPSAWKTRAFDFGDGPAEAVTFPWGDVSTAYHSTGIPNVEVYMRLPRAMRRTVAATRYLGWLLGAAPVQALLARRVRAGKPGPTAAERARGRSVIRGEVEDDAGGRAAARMRTPDGYSLTAMTAVEAVRKVLGGEAPPGFQTPSRAYGADWVLEIPGVTREDLAA